MEYTKGPWEWDGDTLRPVVRDPDVSATHTILDGVGNSYSFRYADFHRSLHEHEGNKALMAASPMLFEALIMAEEFMAGFDGDELQDGIEIRLAIIRDALARVTDKTASAQEGGAAC